jgi:hypothetical protein
MGGNFILDSIGSVEIALLSIFVTVGLGLLGTLSALSAKSSGQLRAA